VLKTAPQADSEETIAMHHDNIKAAPLDPTALAEGFWVFGYGSLMWKPGFPYAERHPATAYGVHRRLCVYSTHYRGTPENPGLVLGLVRGGCCHGMAFKVRATDAAETLAYLTAREQISRVYHEQFRPVRLREGHVVRALCYVVDESHRQFAGRLPPADQLRLVERSHGSMGPNRDYVCNTARLLTDIGVEDRILSWLARRLDEAEIPTDSGCK
jgi:glutathione-specific gamma-glutamylcyclotransferase